MYYSYVPSPLGDLLVAGSDAALSAVSFPTGSRRRDPLPDWIFSDRPFAEARRQLGEYFAGERREFDLPLAPAGTAFQRAVWDELVKILYGTTVSYADVAARIGRPTALRAVGRANGANPLPIVVPCHRVVGSGGELTGFGGGLAAKKALLRLELEHSGFPHVAG